MKSSLRSKNKAVSERGSVQRPLIRHAEAAGWSYVPPDAALTKRRGETGGFFYDELEAALKKLNPGFITDENLQSAVSRIENQPASIYGNKKLLDWLRGSEMLLDEREGHRRSVRLIDFKETDQNRFQVTEEWSLRSPGGKTNRADVVFLINGVPVAIVENKNPKSADAMEKAIQQLRRYEAQTPELLVAPQVFNVTHLLDYFYGVTWNYTSKNIFRWKESRDETFAAAVKSFFHRPWFLEMLREWILFYEKDDELQKTVLRQHQTRASAKIVDRCRDGEKTRGLIWHTQGSGKTFTLIAAARRILENQKEFPGATVILVVDRNELEGQLSGWVERIMGEMQGLQIKVKAVTSKEDLRQALRSDFRGLIVTMIHKFDSADKNLCARDHVYVFIDEAHRSTGGDLGNYLVGALPKATLIGFSGTPIDQTAYGGGTFKIFGKYDEKGYLDRYTIKESIEDGTTLKLHHRLAPNDFLVSPQMLDQEFYSLAETEGVSDIEELNRILSRAVHLRAFLKSQDRVKKAARFIAEHFREHVEPLGCKAFLVGVDREACALYKAALDQILPKEYSECVYTASPTDVTERPLVSKYQLDDAQEKAVRKLFVKPDQLPKILIVTDKLLTGFDAPILQCMYLDKPMRDHVLLQAIARVNRPYEDAKGWKKPCGLVVDLVGMLGNLKKALSFEGQEVSGVIEDLNLLMERFRMLMKECSEKYLRPYPRVWNDAVIDTICGRFAYLEERGEFVDAYRELEALYEILSPDPELRDFMDDFHRLVEMYLVIQNNLLMKKPMNWSLAKKTEDLVREGVAAQGFKALSKPAVFDEATLSALMKQKDRIKETDVINLGISLAGKDPGMPQLLGLAERAQTILNDFQEKQIDTVKAMEMLQKLFEEKAKLAKEREAKGLSGDAFAVYCVLKDYGLSDKNADETASHFDQIRQRYPNAKNSTEESRQLRAALYGLLISKLGREKIADCVERIMEEFRGEHV